MPGIDRPKSGRPFDYLIFCGRFQPPHRGHLKVIEEGLRRAARVIVLCGGVEVPRSVQFPWTFAERVDMLRAPLTQDDLARVRVLPAPDNLYRPEKWAASIEVIVDAELRAEGRDPASARIGILGTTSNDRALAGRLFPQWAWVDVDPIAECDAAAIRAQLFCAENADPVELEKLIPGATLSRLRGMVAGTEFDELRAEFASNEASRDAWAAAPWPPVFVTVDAVVVARGQLLLIKRRRRPGKGLWALPGGFLDPHERLVEACVRELQEETNIALDAALLYDSIRSTEVFDDPARSARGRTVTHTYLIDLSALPAVPRVRGGDDASLARWFPLQGVRRGQLFEDHYAILQAMLGVE